MTSASTKARPEPRSAALGTIVLGLALLGLGLFVGYEAMGIAVSPSYAKIGPRVFPMVIAAGLVLLGLALTVEALRGRWTARLTDAEPGEWRERPLWRIGLVGAGLVLDVALMRPAGFIVASALLFTLATQGFGSRRPIRDLAIGVAMGAIIYFFFNDVLGVRLPAGQLWT